MRWTRSTALTLAAAALATALAALSCTTQPTGRTAAAPDTSASVERGRYLTTIVGCNDCHTPGALFGGPDMKRQLSGSELGWSGPWGTTYARNLTPDAATGLGSWSEDDIVKAIRTGVRPDGSGLLPPMPWPDLAHLTDQDAHSIALFLKSLPPVSHKVPDKLPPGSKPKGAALMFPAPPAWDTPRQDTTQSAAPH